MEIGAIVGIIGPLAGAAALIVVAVIQSRKSTPADTSRANVDRDRLSLEAFERFQTATERRMEDQEQRIEYLEKQVGRVTRVLRILREAFRDYIRQVRLDWGVNEHPPTITDDIRELLAEDDLDMTFPAHEAREKRAQETNPKEPSNG